ncbi:MAG TPA: sulfite reductase subunit alpha [Chthoniobacteraceae bacterium]|jgi:sulfite reductase (NADPH) flavoprotein alpha-component|nr:sulfite reductase subunit alpha [Chthoniobacteraceae bacterium]
MSTETAPASAYSRKNPFPAPLLVNRKLTLEGSQKDTRHFELGLAGSGLVYECGDSIGVFAKNDPALVDEILHALHATGEETVPGNDGIPKPLRTALLQDYQITQPSRQFVQAISERGGEAASLLRELHDPLRKGDLEEYLWGMEYVDFLTGYPSVHLTPEEFVKLLRKLQPRLYSIASSQKAHKEAVHLTVAVVHYESHGRNRNGVCSTFLAERVGDCDRVPVFVHTAKGFRMPEDGNTPIIMVGPGTGVAPFRAYLQDRKATGAKGKNWLLFGEQRRNSDFLYEEEFTAFQNEGLLTRLDTAFSRDQAHKVYVQNRMLENAGEIWKWIDQEGAHFFVCGDASRMAKDVDAALLKIVETEGKKTPEEAALYVEELKKTKRYKRDVY